MTLTISMLNNIFPLHIKLQTIISSILMSYIKFHSVNVTTLKS